MTEPLWKLIPGSEVGALAILSTLHMQCCGHLAFRVILHAQQYVAAGIVSVAPEPVILHAWSGRASAAAEFFAYAEN